MGYFVAALGSNFLKRKNILAASDADGVAKLVPSLRHERLACEIGPRDRLAFLDQVVSPAFFEKLTLHLRRKVDR